MSGWTLGLLLLGIALMALAGRFRRKTTEARRAPESDVPRRPSHMETLSEALRRLGEAGWTDSFQAAGAGLRALQADRELPPEELAVDDVLRFEGESDPGDATALYLLRHPASGIRGTLVTSFGAAGDPALVELVRRLPDPAHPGRS